jgi:asparagine synthase (glutamine-hydrolysing)
MCGITGIFCQKIPENIDIRLNNAISKMANRGPDDQGRESYTIANGMLSFGHTRLSIIDLSDGGHQPMQTPDGRYSIVYNGEIYNYLELREELKNIGYIFVSDSDTEVLLHAWVEWGHSCLKRLIGMFSFAVFDTVTKELTCTRDAYGIKPFYYSMKGSNFSFASEIPALLELLDEEPSLNMQLTFDYLNFGIYDKGMSTFYNGIERLEPGHILSINLLDEKLTPRIERWWYPSIEQTSNLSFEDAAEKLREMFLKNMKLFLRSDVPIGAALSGGIDSSAVVCAMRYLEPDLPINTFSYIAEKSSINEEKWVDVVNRHVNANSYKVTISSDELVNDLDDLIETQGEPFGNTSIYAQYRVFKLANENGIKVMLDGQGADESLAGYELFPGYPWQRIKSLLGTKKYLEFVQFVYSWFYWPGRTRQLTAQTIKLFLGAFSSQHTRSKLLNKFGVNSCPEWLNKSYLEKNEILFDHHKQKKNDDHKGRNLMGQLRRELTGDILDRLLRYEDRNSMRWSIESRVPFLTTELSEFFLSLPEHYLISNSGQTKHVFREAMRGIVPDEILNRKDKIGFETPEHNLLRGVSQNVGKWFNGIDRIRMINSKIYNNIKLSLLDGKSPFSSWQVWRFINYDSFVHKNNLSEKSVTCKRCIMDTTDEKIEFDENGFCNHCNKYFNVYVKNYPMNDDAGKDQISRMIEKIKKEGKGKPYDCMIGLSGGADSSFLAKRVVELGLKPLAIHFDSGWNSEMSVNNIETIVKSLKLDLKTIVCDWEEMRDLQVSFLKASIPNCDIPQDHAFYSVLWKEAAKNNIKYILSGHNMATESILPSSWGYRSSDLRYLKNIQNTFGNKKLVFYPRLGFFNQYIYYPMIKNIKIIFPLDYMNYNKEAAMKELKDTIGWKQYGGKHHESIFTRFSQAYYLPKKFGFDKRKPHLSSLIVSNQISRDDAINILSKDPYNDMNLKQDREFVLKKLRISEELFEEIMNTPPKSYRDYKSNARLYSLLLKIKTFINR